MEYSISCYSNKCLSIVYENVADLDESSACNCNIKNEFVQKNAYICRELNFRVDKRADIEKNSNSKIAALAEFGVDLAV